VIERLRSALTDYVSTPAFRGRTRNAAFAQPQCTKNVFQLVKNPAQRSQLMHSAALLPVPQHWLFPSGGLTFTPMGHGNVALFLQLARWGV